MVVVKVVEVVFGSVGVLTVVLRVCVLFVLCESAILLVDKFAKIYEQPGRF